MDSRLPVRESDALANEEAEDQAVEALRLVELHPMAGAFEALVAPQSRDAGSGAQHLRFCQVRISTAPDAQGGGLHVWECPALCVPHLRRHVGPRPIERRGQSPGPLEVFDPML